MPYSSLLQMLKSMLFLTFCKIKKSWSKASDDVCILAFRDVSNQLFIIVLFFPFLEYCEIASPLIIVNSSNMGPQLGHFCDSRDSFVSSLKNWKWFLRYYIKLFSTKICPIFINGGILNTVCQNKGPSRVYENRKIQRSFQGSFG